MTESDTSPEIAVQTERGTAREGIFVACAALAVVIAGVMSYARFWMSDDAFISFTYARNLVRGNGLVFNVGERVEGYTNFLWTMIVALGMKLGVDPVVTAGGLGIACMLAVIVLLAVNAWSRRKTEPGVQLFFPLAALAVALHKDCNVFATGGLETALFTLLVTALYLRLLSIRSARSLAGAGFIAFLMLLTRPDGILFVAVAGIFLFLTQPRPLRQCAVFLAPLLALYTPYWFWRFWYYGYPFPNTFYAKSINLPYYSQGLEYVRMYLVTYYVFLLIPLLVMYFGVFRYHLAVPALKGRKVFREFCAAHQEWIPVLLGLMFVGAQAAFVIRIGGDFMFARFLIPVTPIAYVVMETLVVRVGGRRVATALVVVALAATVFRVNLFGNAAFVGYVADEARYYENEPLEVEKQLGDHLHQLWQGVNVRLAFYGARARLMYYIDPQIAIEAATGLTDKEIAHRNLVMRGRPGHEKTPPVEYLAQRRVHLYFDNEPRPDGSLNRLQIHHVSGMVVNYDTAVMNPLRADPEIQFTHVPEILDTYIAQLPTFDRRAVATDYATLKPFYFDNTFDTLRQNKIVRFLADSAGTAHPQ